MDLITKNFILNEVDDDVLNEEAELGVADLDMGNDIAKEEESMQDTA